MQQVRPHFGPLKSGYAEFFGPMSGGVDYFTHRDSSGARDLYSGEQERGRPPEDWERLLAQAQRETNRLRAIAGRARPG